MLQRGLGARGAMAACAPRLATAAWRNETASSSPAWARVRSPRGGRRPPVTTTVVPEPSPGQDSQEHRVASIVAGPVVSYLGRRIESALYDEEGEATCGSRSARERATRGRSRLRRSGSSSGARRVAISSSRTTRSPASMPPCPSTPRAAIIVEDLRSTNGTYVNGRRITEPTHLGPDDELRIGESQINASVIEPGTGAPRTMLAGPGLTVQQGAQSAPPSAPSPVVPPPPPQQPAPQYTPPPQAAPPPKAAPPPRSARPRQPLRPRGLPRARPVSSASCCASRSSAPRSSRRSRAPECSSPSSSSCSSSPARSAARRRRRRHRRPPPRSSPR